MSVELDALILDNLGELTETAQRIEDLEKRVFAAVGEVSRAWAARNGWIGEFTFPGYDYHEETQYWLAPAAWRIPGEDVDADFWFIPGAWGPPPRYQSWLASLTGTGQGGVGFRLIQDYLTDRQWAGRQRREIKSLSLAVPHDEDGFFLAFTLDNAALAAAAWNGDFGKAMEPLIAALDRLPQLLPVLEGLIASVRQQAQASSA